VSQFSHSQGLTKAERLRRNRPGSGERYRIEKPERLKARDAVNNAVKAGKLSKQPCAVCGSSARIHGHHEDYSKPLEVIWLCPVHHKERHRQIQEEHEASYQFDAISE
jgi:hypothetical protein